MGDETQKQHLVYLCRFLMIIQPQPLIILSYTEGSSNSCGSGFGLFFFLPFNMPLKGSELTLSMIHTDGIILTCFSNGSPPECTFTVNLIKNSSQKKKKNEVL